MASGILLISVLTVGEVIKSHFIRAPNKALFNEEPVYCSWKCNFAMPSFIEGHGPITIIFPVTKPRNLPLFCMAWPGLAKIFF
jgi:hypothetical protein